MGRAQAQYLRIFDDTTSYARWQSYYVNQSVTLSGDSYEYMPFNASGIVQSGASGGKTVLVEAPSTTSMVEAITLALSNGRFCELRVFEFDSRLDQTAPQSGQTLIATYTAKVINVSGTFTSLNFELGSSLSPVGAQVPPRKFTSYLIGAPLRI
tara:strand:- start:132 stop:593 length:462 start_codon:yes stop_codon:yes gene_type:complete